MINLRKSNVEKIMMSLRNLRNNDKPSYMMPYNIKRSTRNEKKFYNEGTCVEDSIFGPRETRNKLGTDAKDGSATAERGSAKRWFHHSFILPC
jgi:hypothetical protein